MTDSTRFRILSAMVAARKPLTLSIISQKTKLVPQAVAYHLIALEDEGLIIRDGYEYFAQPILVDIEMHDFCAEKLSEIIDAFSAQDSSIVVQDKQNPDDVILNTLRALIQLVLPKKI